MAEWYNTGSPKVDAKHFKLLALATQLWKACKKPLVKRSCGRDDLIVLTLPQQQSPSLVNSSTLFAQCEYNLQRFDNLNTSLTLITVMF